MRIQGYQQQTKHQLPKDWKYETIEQCCNILDFKRIPLNSQERRKIPGKIPYYGANGVQGYINKFIFDEDLILLAEDGGNFTEYETKPIAYYVTGKSWVNNHAHILTSKNNNDLKWIFYSLVHKNILPWIRGTTRTKLNQSELLKITIPIPLLQEQQRIASFLSKVDDLIQKTGKIIAQTRTLKKGLMQTLLTKGIGHTKFKRISLGFSFLQENIPQSWSVIPIKEASVSGLQNGIFKNRQEFGKGVPIVNVSDLFSEYDIDINRVERVSVNERELKQFAIEEGDIFFCRSSLVINGIGKCNIVTRLTEPAVFECHVMMLRPNKTIVHPKFLSYYTQSEIARKYLMSIAMTLTMTTIRQPDLENLPVIVPPLEEQFKILSIIRAQDAEIQIIQKYMNRLKYLKRGLMQKLLTGNIRVKE